MAAARSKHRKPKGMSKTDYFDLTKKLYGNPKGQIVADSALISSSCYLWFPGRCTSNHRTDKLCRRRVSNRWCAEVTQLSRRAATFADSLSFLPDKSSLCTSHKPRSTWTVGGTASCSRTRQASVCRGRGGLPFCSAARMQALETARSERSACARSNSLGYWSFPGSPEAQSIC